MKKYHPAYFGVYLALALISSYVESLIPFYFGIPGVKLGLTNLVIVLVLYELGFGPAIVLSCPEYFWRDLSVRQPVQHFVQPGRWRVEPAGDGAGEKTGKLSIAGVSICGGIFAKCRAECW